MPKGAKSKCVIANETTYGTANTTGAYVLPVKSESVNNDIDYEKSEIWAGVRGTRAMGKGKMKVGGSLDLEAYPNSLGMLFYLALGKVAVNNNSTPTPTTDDYLEITPGDELPSFTLGIDHDSANGGFSYLFSGSKVKTLKFSAAVGSKPQINIDVIAKSETEGTMTGTPVATGTDPYYMTELTISQDGTNFNADKFSQVDFTINNNVDDGDHRLDGTGVIKTAESGQLEIDGTFEMICDKSEYDKFKNGTTTRIDMKLSKTAGKDIIISLPKIQYTKMTHDIADGGRIKMKGDFKALLDANDVCIKVTDKTRTTAYFA